FVVTTSAPLDISGLPRGSNLTKNWRPAASFNRKPGVTPSVFAATTVQGPDGEAGKRSGPCTISAIDSGRRPIRLINQFESSTSSSEFTSIARDGMFLPVRVGSHAGDDAVVDRD